MWTFQGLFVYHILFYLSINIERESEREGGRQIWLVRFLCVSSHSTFVLEMGFRMSKRVRVVLWVEYFPNPPDWESMRLFTPKLHMKENWNPGDCFCYTSSTHAHYCFGSLPTPQSITFCLQTSNFHLVLVLLSPQLNCKLKVSLLLCSLLLPPGRLKSIRTAATALWGQRCPLKTLNEVIRD